MNKDRMTIDQLVLSGSRHPLALSRYPVAAAWTQADTDHRSSSVRDIWNVACLWMIGVYPVPTLEKRDEGGMPGPKAVAICLPLNHNGITHRAHSQTQNNHSPDPKSTYAVRLENVTGARLCTCNGLELLRLSKEKIVPVPESMGP